MAARLVSNLNKIASFSFVRLPRSVGLIEALVPRGGSGVGGVLRYSSGKTMATSGSMVASGDLVVDSLLSNCGSLSGFVKPGGVYYNDRSFKICRKARVRSMRSGNRDEGVGGFVVFDVERRCSSYGNSARNLSSLCYSDGVSSEVSTDGSFSGDHLSSLAISTEQRSSVLKLVSGACYMPHPAKEATGGEDAHFICVDEQVIGVADGVGGWADVGVNAGDYARELMSNSVKAIREIHNGEIDPLAVLEKAHAETKAMGSSTAVIIALKDKGLHAINLGDSGFIIVREGSLIFESPVQQHGFNFTYQLERGTRGDQPSSGQIFEIPVLPGDIVVAGSDGLFDNLYNKEVAAIVGNAVREGLGPDATAQKIATSARVRALDRKHQTPFSTAAQEAGFTFYGGKLDDLTVLVSYVSTSANA